MRPPILPLIVGLLLLMGNGGCLKLSLPPRSADDLPLPASYSLAGVMTTPGERWWEDFHVQRLNELIRQSLQGNLTLQTYRARLMQSRAQARKTGASSYPVLSGEIEAGVGRQHSQLTGRTGGTESYAAGLLASYELDLWGRLEAQRQAANLTVAASREDLKAAAMTIAAETANRWVGIITQRELKKLLATQLATNQTYLELVELRFRQSQASALDVLQQHQLVEAIRAQLPLIELQEQLLNQNLAVLLGNWANESIDPGSAELPALPALPALGLPARLLTNRPDLQGAYFRLKAADQGLLAARADLLPNLSLSARADFDSNRLGTILDDWLAKLLASLTAPLLDGGRRQAEVAVSEAVSQEQLAHYRGLLHTALQEVEAALHREASLAEHLRGLERQLQFGRQALNEARSRYLNGLTDYLPVLTQLLAVQALEKDLLSRRGEILFARIDLYRALGGSWTDELPNPPEPS